MERQVYSPPRVRFPRPLSPSISTIERSRSELSPLPALDWTWTLTRVPSSASGRWPSEVWAAWSFPETEAIDRRLLSVFSDSERRGGRAATIHPRNATLDRRRDWKHKQEAKTRRDQPIRTQSCQWQHGSKAIAVWTTNSKGVRRSAGRGWNSRLVSINAEWARGQQIHAPSKY